MLLTTSIASQRLLNSKLGANFLERQEVSRDKHAASKTQKVNPKTSLVLDTLETSEEKTTRLEILNAKQAPLTDMEVASIVEIECHPKVQKWLYDYAFSSSKKELHDYQVFFKRLPKNRKVDILVAKSDGKIIGFLALWGLGVYMKHVATIGVSVHPHYWGKGVATRLIKSAIELARQKGIERLEVETLSENNPMRHVIEKVGFELESIRERRIKKDGLNHDEAVYFLLL
ncbi:MAG: hypothetical protein QG670_1832 [Thermoproteota archaeon]|nr:hypothetical protein [Thermoproteota archaeon]